MIRTKMSHHAKTDRLERLTACLENIGCGEVILETTHQNARYRLTSTGLILVYNLTEEVLITGYMATISKCTAMYHSSGYQKVPQAIKKTVVRNQKLYGFLLDM